MQGGSGFTVIGTNNNVASGTNTTTTWANLQAATEYEWFVTVSDGISTTTGPTWRFTTTTPPQHNLSVNAANALSPDSPTISTTWANRTLTANPDAGGGFAGWFGSTGRH